MPKIKLSRDIRMLLMAEERNIDGTQPPTLKSAYASFIEAPDKLLVSMCGYQKEYPFYYLMLYDMGKEFRRLIRISLDQNIWKKETH